MSFIERVTTGRAGIALRLAAATLAGALGSVAFSVAAANWFLLVSLAVLFLTTVRTETKKEGFAVGWLWGLAFFSIGLRWCYGSLHDHGQLPAVLSVAAIVLLAGVLALFIGTVTGLTRAFPISRRLKLIVLLPTLWSVFELLRGVEPAGFGWLSIGYAYSTDFFGAWAPLAGVYGVGFVVVLTVGLAVELLFPAEDKKPWLKTLDAIAIGALALVTLALNDVTYSERGPKLEVRLVQPDLPVTMAYRPAEAAARIDRAVAMSNRSAMGKPLDLIVWPESTIVTPLRDGLDSAALAAVDVAEKTGAAVVFNAFFREGPGRYYNAMWMAESNHRPARLIYRKHHLVPFGEFVPTGFRWFVDALGIPMTDQLRGPVGGDPLREYVRRRTAARLGQGQSRFHSQYGESGMVYRRGFAAIYGDECYASPGNGASAYSGGAKCTLGFNRTGRQDATIGVQGRSESGYDGGDGHGISDAFCSVRTLAADRSSCLCAHCFIRLLLQISTGFRTSPWSATLEAPDW